MSHPRFARRATAVSASFVLAFGACGVAASAAFADTTPTAPAVTTSAGPTDTPEAAEPTFTLTNNSAGSFSLAITIPGTSIAVDYTVDPTGAVTGATTSTTGATVTVDGHDLTVILADGRAVKVELGDAGDAVKEVSVDEANNNQDQNGDKHSAEKSGNKHRADKSAHQQAGDQQSGDEGDNQEPATAPEPARTQSPAATAPEPVDTQSPAASDNSGDSKNSSESTGSDSGSHGSDGHGSGSHDSGSSDGGGN